MQFSFSALDRPDLRAKVIKCNEVQELVSFTTWPVINRAHVVSLLMRNFKFESVFVRYFHSIMIILHLVYHSLSD